MIPNDISAYLATITEPDDVIPTVDEFIAELDAVASQHPDLARWKRYGTSRLGDPIRILSIGHGPDNVFILGNPHANEPIGAITIRHLVRLVIEHAELREGLTFHFLPWMNPDASRLNEGWFKTSRSVRDYLENFHRATPLQDTDFVFPVLGDPGYFDRPLPETQAVMLALEELRPILQLSLHNLDFGGAYFLLDEDVPGLPDELTALFSAVELPPAPPSPMTAALANPSPGMFILPPAHEISDGVASAGAMSAHWASRYGTRTLVTEVPMWSDSRSGNTALTDESLPEVHQAMAATLQRSASVYESILEEILPDLRHRSPLIDAAEDLVRMTVADGARLLGSAPEESSIDGTKASVDEVYIAACAPVIVESRIVSQLRRGLAVEIAAGNRTPSIRAAALRIEELFEEVCARMDRLHSNGTFALERLARLQVGGALIALRHLSRRHDGDSGAR